jgi:hypothetical protein
VLEESSSQNSSSRFLTITALTTQPTSSSSQTPNQQSPQQQQQLQLSHLPHNNNNNSNNSPQPPNHPFSIFEMLEENMNGSTSSSNYDLNGHRMAQNSNSTDQSSASISSASANGTSTNNNVSNNCGDYTNGINHNNHHNNDYVQQNQNIQLDNTNRDIVRLIGQHLKLIGLDRTAQMLMQESGCTLEHPAATKFREHVLSGDWHKADYDLQELQTIVDDDKLTKSNLIEMKFLLLEQKYLEYLDDSRPIDALHVLRNELTPLQHNTPRVHQLSSYMMCTNNEVIS